MNRKMARAFRTTDEKQPNGKWSRAGSTFSRRQRREMLRRVGTTAKGRCQLRKTIVTMSREDLLTLSWKASQV